MLASRSLVRGAVDPSHLDEARMSARLANQLQEMLGELELVTTVNEAQYTVEVLDDKE